MSFDTVARSRLANLVGDIRTLLTSEFVEQCQRLFGIELSGKVTDVQLLGHLDEAQRATAILLRERVDYLARTHPAENEAAASAVMQLVREQAFTVLNRFAALRMAERRGLVPESVRRGYQSKGFKVFEAVARTGLRDAYDRYRHYLLCLFDELALDLGVLFDRLSPQGVLFPREPVLLACLELLNAHDVDPLWAEDETIGWVYQYYNDPTERKEMREAPAPRNSRELAVRNQFFTPRYVVEFLIDNSLGRIWYEMTQGGTTLRETCRFLVLRSSEVFLQPGVPEPEAALLEDVGQDRLSGQPVYIPYRQLKDPREIRMLDPACGSMHFGLYAFDLFEVIYEEAWEIARAPMQLRGISSSFAAFASLVAGYSDKAAFVADVPCLIIENNLHGIDIDPRAAQIAALSLWLRAQRAWQRQGVRPEHRSRIRRSNVVCAEPMPGDAAALEEFIASQLADAPENRLLGRLIRRVFDGMRLAGEAGSLLKIGEEVAEAVAEAKRSWLAAPKPEQGRLFGKDQAEVLQQSLAFDVAEITDEAFWINAEERVYAALRSYADEAQNIGGYQRRLFVEDAARGFAFVDLCRKRFDVVTMNPPFGAGPDSVKNYVNETYPVGRADIGIAFVERGIELCDDQGMVGAITSRVLLANDGLEEWRHSRLIAGGHLRCFVDLGFGVLDDAVVEAAAYTISASAARSDTFFLRVLDERDKEAAVTSFVVHKKRFSRTFHVWRQLAIFENIPSKVLCYWLPLRFLTAFSATQHLKKCGGNARHGLQTTDDGRFLRLAWEVRPSDVGEGRKWVMFAKGGEYRPYWDDLHLTINWENDGNELKSFVSAKAAKTLGAPGWSRWINAWDDYFKSGLTFPERTTSDFSPRVLPAGCIFSATGEAIIFTNRELALSYLVGAYTRPFKVVVDAFVGSGDCSVPGSAAKHYRSGLINSLPFPAPVLEGIDSDDVVRAVGSARQRSRFDETSRDFVASSLISEQRLLREAAAERSRQHLSSAVELINLVSKAEPSVMKHLGFSVEDDAVIDSVIGPNPAAYEAEMSADDTQLLGELWALSEQEIVKRAVARHGARRQLTKLSYCGDRRIELLAHYFEVRPQRLLESLGQLSLHGTESIRADTIALISYLFGVAMGRWDVSRAKADEGFPLSPDPFASLSVCPPGQLQNEQGLPLSREDQSKLKEQGRWNYALEIPWDGILVDEPGHRFDVETCLHSVFEAIWRDRWEAIEREACAIVGVSRLRDYIRRPSSFFADHLKQHSKSRRQAPIYWPLSTTKGTYTVWIYYHRLTGQTLHTAIADFVGPKIRATERALADARAVNERAQVDELSDLLLELREFRADLERIIALPWIPNLNDGELITASPLWKLFRLPKWQQDLKSAWQRLQAGDHDWSQLALSLWPDRVKAACETDRSIAIAHGLEHLFQEPVVTKKANSRSRKRKGNGVR